MTASEAVNKDGNTYLLVVDESNQLDQLSDSQTFYIDSNSLANGDLSNMVLTTEQPLPVQVPPQSNGHNVITAVQDNGNANLVPVEQPTTTN